MLNYKQLKRIIATCAFSFGFVATALALLSIWDIGGVNFFENQPPLNKIFPTTAILTLAFICLLAILKMAEEKKN